MSAYTNSVPQAGQAKKRDKSVMNSGLNFAPAERLFPATLKHLSDLPSVGGIDEEPLLIELSSVLRHVTAEINAHGGKGEVTLKIVIAKRGDGLVDILPDVSYKLPKRKKSVMRVWANDKGEICRGNPKQPDIPGLNEDPVDDGQPVDA